MGTARHTQLISIINYDELDAIEANTYISNYSSTMLMQQEQEHKDLEENRIKLVERSNEIDDVIRRLGAIKIIVDKTIVDHNDAIQAKLSAISDLKRAHIRTAEVKT